MRYSYDRNAGATPGTPAARGIGSSLRRAAWGTPTAMTIHFHFYGHGQPTLVWLGALAFTAARLCCEAQSPDEFNPGSTNYVQSLAVQVDGSILVGGSWGLGGFSCSGLGRLSWTGARDLNFQPPSGTALAIAAQEDGKIVFACAPRVVVGGDRYAPIFRITANGSQDGSFTPKVRCAGTSDSPAICALASQPDGRILVGGIFSRVDGHYRTNLARLNPDGTTDETFNPGTSVRDQRFNGVYCLALQLDGKILIGGVFTNVAGSARSNLARLFPDGTVDPSFHPYTDGYVCCLVVQPDGKILVGGQFMYLEDQLTMGLGRLNPDGTADADFMREEAWAPAYSLALQADGDIVVGGDFSWLNGVPCGSVGRVHADGAPDWNFIPDAGGWVRCVALQSDGRVLLGGNFTNVGGLARLNIARLSNNVPATESLLCDGSTITWLRGGSSPEVWRTQFAFSTNGTNWTDLGAGTRINGGWRSGNVSLPAQATIRARGHVQGTGGHIGGSSSWYVESLTQFVRPTLTVDQASSAGGTNGFCVFLSGAPGRVAVVEASNDLAHWWPIATNLLSHDPLRVCDRSATTGAAWFYRAMTP